MLLHVPPESLFYPLSAPIPTLDRSTLPERAAQSSTVIIREWRRLLSLGPARLVKAGTRLFGQASSARAIFLIESGLVKLSRTSNCGRERALLLRSPGDLVGACGTLLRMPHLVSATAVTDCRLISLPVGRALETFHTSAEAASFLAQQQMIDAIRISSLLMEARTLVAEQRFFRFLLQLAVATNSVRSADSRVSARVPLSEAEIADLIGMNCSAFSRLKRVLIRNGYLLQRDKNVYSFSRHLAAADIST